MISKIISTSIMIWVAICSVYTVQKLMEEMGHYISREATEWSALVIKSAIAEVLASKGRIELYMPSGINVYVIRNRIVVSKGGYRVPVVIPPNVKIKVWNDGIFIKLIIKWVDSHGGS